MQEKVEVLEIDSKIKNLIANRKSSDDIRAYIATKKIRTMRDEVLDLLRNGTTTIDEAINILYTVD